MGYRFASDSNGTGVQYDLGNSDSLVVPTNVTVISQDNAAITASGQYISIAVLGFVGALDNALSLSTSGTSTTTSRSITVGTNGTLSSGNIGIYDYGDGDRIFNRGQIYAHTGIEVGSSAVSASFTVYNYGTIMADQGVNSLSPALKLYNYGTINGASLYAVITSFGNDLLYNKGQIDGLVQLGGGNDTLLNRGLINGNVGMGDGADTLDNRAGTIDGLIGMGDGNDTFIPGASNETADGGINEDTIDFSRSSGVHFALDGSIDATGWASGDSYSNFEDLLGSVLGNDILVGDSFGNVIGGFGGNDNLSGQGGNDTLVGGRGNDTLNGGAGDDTLKGGDGNDILTGGADHDVLTGGLGADKFVFGEGEIKDDAATTAFEKITDFSEAEKDRVDLSAIDANTLVAGDQAFSFIGYAVFHKVAGELHVEHFAGADVISGDTNGDGTADFYLSFVGVTSLVAGDFVL
jgi:Ca2+-binding RTX toxin-like protein